MFNFLICVYNVYVYMGSSVLLRSLELANKSLAQLANVENDEEEVEEKREEKEEDYLSYSLHDIIMEYLKNNVTLEKQKGYHLQLVQKYSDKCVGAFAELEEDGYIHSQLLIHVHAAGNMELLSQLLTNLLWVAACCEHWYASALLDSYKHYQACVHNEVKYNTIIFIVHACKNHHYTFYSYL